MSLNGKDFMEVGEPVEISDDEDDDDSTFSKKKEIFEGKVVQLEQLVKEEELEMLS